MKDAPPVAGETGPVPAARRGVKGGADIAIIGMACKFPGANSPGRYWENLAGGINSIRQITPDHWDIEKYYSPDRQVPNKSYSKWCGTIDNIDRFDNLFFNISPREARNMDPQQRLLLEKTWHCIEDSGVPLNVLREKKTSVYVGVMASDYRLEASDPGIATDGYAVSGNYDVMLANRISYVFGFHGTSISIDAACASSLVAMNSAKRSLMLGESDFALAAGVNLNIHPWKYISFSKARMLSPDGQCKTFDAAANGFVSGEGIGVLLLQRLDDALASNNTIHGIIRGLAVNHGGQTRSMTAPRVEAQCDVILSAYKEAGFGPESVTYVEAHGTGTSLGDPIEMEALTRAFRCRTHDRHYCKIGSVKTNIGHLEAAAGVASVIKVLMMMRHGTIPPTLNIRTLNPMIHLKHTPFILAEKKDPWRSRKQGQPLRAGISCFGLGGVNAHLILEEYIQPPSRRYVENSQFFVISAKTPESVRKMVETWRAFTKKEAFASLRLKDICRTQLTGRVSFAYRYGFRVESKKALRERLLDVSLDHVAATTPKAFCLRIGHHRLVGYADLQPLLRRDKTFRKHLARLNSILNRLAQTCNSFEELHYLKALETGLKKKVWPEDERALYTFVVGYAAAATLMDLGVVPDLVSGEKNGVWTTLALSGIITLVDALSVLTGIKQPEDLVLSRPAIPFFDPISRKLFLPYVFSQEYLNFLLSRLHTGDELFAYYIEKAGTLLSTQFTFKKYMQEWNRVLAPLGKDVEQMISRASDASCASHMDTKEKILIVAIIISSLRRLRHKWDLQLQKPKVNAVFNELVDLIIDEVMTKEMLVELIFGALEDKNAIAESMTLRQHRISKHKPYPFIKIQNKVLGEIKDFPGWLKKMADKDTLPPLWENLINMEVGDMKVNTRPDHAVSVNLHEILVDPPRDFLLRLWLKGVDIKWDLLYPAHTFKKVPLPGYAFNGKPFWISHPERGPCVEKTNGVTPPPALEQGIPEGEKKDLNEMARLKDKTIKFLKDILSELTELDSSDLDDFIPFADFGVDSLMIHQFNHKMERRFHCLSPTLLFEYQTIHELAQYFISYHRAALLDLFGRDPGQKEPEKHGDLHPAAPAKERKIKPGAEIEPFTVKPKAQNKSLAGHPIAVIGLAGRFPDAVNPDAFWNNLKAGKDAITEVPASRWSLEDYYDPDPERAAQGKMYCKWGGFVEDVDKFDPLFFNISPGEAQVMDPQERLFLETAWHTLEDAGYTGKAIRDSIQAGHRSDVGVFVGISANTYMMLGSRDREGKQVAMPTSMQWSVANRVSHVLNFQGPSLSVDTACSSSLTALHMACESLRHGECSLALAGGVNLYLHPSRYSYLCRMTMLSPTGKCRSFGQGADGFVPGEGVGAVLLKPLADAIHDRDHIYAVIKGSAVNHGGRMQGYTVPNPNAQAELISRVLGDMDPRSISYMEAHGTGTALGDPIEIAGLKKAYERGTGEKQFCAIGSVKTNIGHLEAAAGIAGLIKVLLQMKYKKLVPSLNAEQVNPGIRFEETAFYLQKNLTDWPRPVVQSTAGEQTYPRRAGVSSFGAGGVNAHVILEEYLPGDPALCAGGDPALPHLIVLSARTEARLRQYAVDLAEFLRRPEKEHMPALSLANLAFTLQVGRQAMAEKLCFTAQSVQEVLLKLEHYLGDNHRVLDDKIDDKTDDKVMTSRNHVRTSPWLHKFKHGQYGRDLTLLTIKHRDLALLGLLWISGVAVPWERLYDDTPAGRMSLPTYPFEKKRYWVPVDVAAPARAHRDDNIGRVADPSLPLDQVLRQWIGELLKLPEDKISLDEDLSEYGFDSIAGVRLMNRIADHYDIELSAADFFQNRNIRALSASLITIRNANKGEKDLSPVALPMSSACSADDVDHLEEGQVDALLYQLMDESRNPVDDTRDQKSALG